MDDHDILPDYPRTRHLPWKANATRDDLIASEKEAACIFTSPHVSAEEKVDAANVGIARKSSGPLIRNRNHFLNKTFSARTPAKQQFSSIWNWYYENEACLVELEKLGGPVSVYGEWLRAVHSVEYSRLPSYFLAFDVYDYERRVFLDPQLARPMLAAAGFVTIPQVHVGPFKNYAQIEALSYAPSFFTDLVPREGVYVKVGDGEKVVERFKMVRVGFIPGEHWSKSSLRKNTLVRSPK